jgi:hypothetical protein
LDGQPNGSTKTFFIGSRLLSGGLPESSSAKEISGLIENKTSSNNETNKCITTLRLKITT